MYWAYLVECDGPGITFLTNTESVLLARNKHPPEGREVLFESDLDLLDGGIRWDASGTP